VKKKRATESHEHVEAPAKITADHSRDRELSPVAGGPRGWRNNGEHPLTLAYSRGWIDQHQFAAGEFYRAMFEKMHRSGRNPLDFIASGVRSNLPWSESQADAIRTIGEIEKKMRETNRIIARKFCGEAYSAAVSIRAAGFTNPRMVQQKIRLALEDLAQAVNGVRVF